MKQVILKNEHLRGVQIDLKAFDRGKHVMDGAMQYEPEGQHLAESGQ